MFDNKPVFVIVNKDKKKEIYKLEVSNEVQKEINALFEQEATELLKKEMVEFTGSYTPLEDESLFINNFELPDKVKEAIRAPETVESFRFSDNNDEIDSIFIGDALDEGGKERFVAAFQRFRKSQYITTDKIRLFWDSNTFVKDGRKGLSVSNNVDCIYKDEKLIFHSYYYARQVFDLVGYYRSASDKEVEDFISSKKISYSGDIDKFKGQCNTWVRRKIASINDSGVLGRYKSKEIQKLAANVGISLKLDGDKLVIPDNNEEKKVLLSFWMRKHIKDRLARRHFCLILKESLRQRSRNKYRCK